jgi:hypothetical protein
MPCAATGCTLAAVKPFRTTTKSPPSAPRPQQPFRAAAAQPRERPSQRDLVALSLIARPAGR